MKTDRTLCLISIVLGFMSGFLVEMINGSKSIALKCIFGGIFTIFFVLTVKMIFNFSSISSRNKELILKVFKTLSLNKNKTLYNLRKNNSILAPCCWKTNDIKVLDSQDTIVFSNGENVKGFESKSTLTTKTYYKWGDNYNRDFNFNNNSINIEIKSRFGMEFKTLTIKWSAFLNGKVEEIEKTNHTFYIEECKSVNKFLTLIREMEINNCFGFVSGREDVGIKTYLHCMKPSEIFDFSIKNRFELMLYKKDLSNENEVVLLSDFKIYVSRKLRVIEKFSEINCKKEQTDISLFFLHNFLFFGNCSFFECFYNAIPGSVETKKDSLLRNSVSKKYRSDIGKLSDSMGLKRIKMITKLNESEAASFLLNNKGIKGEILDSENDQNYIEIKNHLVKKMRLLGLIDLEKKPIEFFLDKKNSKIGGNSSESKLEEVSLKENKEEALEEISEIKKKWENILSDVKKQEISVSNLVQKNLPEGCFLDENSANQYKEEKQKELSEKIEEINLKIAELGMEINKTENDIGIETKAKKLIKSSFGKEIKKLKEVKEMEIENLKKMEERGITNLVKTMSEIKVRFNETRIKLSKDILKDLSFLIGVNESTKIENLTGIRKIKEKEFSRLLSLDSKDSVLVNEFLGYTDFKKEGGNLIMRMRKGLIDKPWSRLNKLKTKKVEGKEIKIVYTKAKEIPKVINLILEKIKDSREFSLFFGRNKLREFCNNDFEALKWKTKDIKEICKIANRLRKEIHSNVWGSLIDSNGKMEQIKISEDNNDENLTSRFKDLFEEIKRIKTEINERLEISKSKFCICVKVFKVYY